MADIQVNLWECITLPLRIAYPVNVCPAQAEGIKAVGESPDVLRRIRKQSSRTAQPNSWIRLAGF